MDVGTAETNPSAKDNISSIFSYQSNEITAVSLTLI
jgi:hypothetical protein